MNMQLEIKSEECVNCMQTHHKSSTSKEELTSGLEPTVISAQVSSPNWVLKCKVVLLRRPNEDEKGNHTLTHAKNMGISPITHARNKSNKQGRSISMLHDKKKGDTPS